VKSAKTIPLLTLCLRDEIACFVLRLKSLILLVQLGGLEPPTS
jgi:hypothetical protein